MTRTWLVTGSSRGLGRALATAALEAGDTVLATARDPEQLSELTHRFGDRVRAVALDVTDPAAVDAAVQAAVDTFGRLDVVANNAGHADSAPIEQTTEEAFRDQLETNLHGVIRVTRAALPVFRRQRSGHFLQFSSIGGRVGGTPGLAAYQTAKAGVEAFSEVLHAEVAPLGIAVTIVEPGAFRTDWGGASMRLAEVAPDYAATVGRVHAQRRQLDGRQPGDPARAAQVLLDVVAAEEPPLRLLLGSDAVQLAERSSRARAREAAVWAGVSRSTDFDGITSLAGLTA
ncbi:Short chain dehydrogenase [Modestobacter italicus]|uniref:Short chain dehydrogenase n=1 Tax=Modestobacter italicus (strain DSM 44449 / CECT 9708 / BC 501) TaxID=2732864 RepID=I4F1W6_MODI5|nr:oxidoreductase [Modestobacter marinus]CCH89629.1 Short chain dehydrogenase [Modestobacter marinus]